MKVVTNLNGTVIGGKPAVSGGVLALHSEPAPGFIRQARVSIEGVTMCLGAEAEVHVPMLELWKLAERVDPRFCAPKGRLAAQIQRQPLARQPVKGPRIAGK